MALQTTFNLVDAYLIARLPAGEVGAAVGAHRDLRSGRRARHHRELRRLDGGRRDPLAAQGRRRSRGHPARRVAVDAHRRGAGLRPRASVGGLGAGFIVRDLIGAKGEVANVATTLPARQRDRAASRSSSCSSSRTCSARSARRRRRSRSSSAGNVFNVFLAVLLIFGPGPAPGLLDVGTRDRAGARTSRAWECSARRGRRSSRAALVLVPIVIILARRFDVFPPKGKRAPGLRAS